METARVFSIHNNSIVIPGRVTAVREMPHFLVWWVLAILWRSQRVSLFSESREML